MRAFQLPDGERSGPEGRGQKVTQAARQAGVLLNTRCGHNGLCSGCLVELVEGTFAAGGERIALDGGAPVRVKGCRTSILSQEYIIRVPRRSLVEASAQVLSEFEPLQGLGPLDPVVGRRLIVIDEPSLYDPASYEALVRRALEREGFQGRIEFPLAVLKELHSAFSGENRRVQVDLARIEDGWRVQEVRPFLHPEPATPSASGAAMPTALAAATDARTVGPPLVGAAIDIGTTSVAVALVDLESGELLASASGYNQQVSMSADVAQRIVDGSDPDGLEELRRLVVDESVNPLIETCCRHVRIGLHDVRAAALSANTVMTHLFLGLSPQSMGGAPFTPVTAAPPLLDACEVGLAIHPRAQVRIYPAISAYVGGDITAGMVTLGLFDKPENTLFIDIGTNGEMILSAHGRLIACATPAGPSFEGGGLSCGTRAAAGAVERIRIDPETGAVSYDVIGGVRPYGICGSAYIDFLAEGLRSGRVDARGRFAVDEAADSPVRVVREGGKVHTSYRVVPRRKTDERESDLVITEEDVATLLQAKAAIFAGVITLLEYAGLQVSDLRTLHLGGGFARHLRVENAVTAGLLPELPPERIHIAGNTSLAGAAALLLHHEVWGRSRRAVSEVEVVELNLIPIFESNFVNALFLPNLDRSLFPKTTASLPGSASRGRARSAPRNALRSASRSGSGDASGNTSGDASGNTSGDASGDASGNTSDTASQGASRSSARGEEAL